MYLKAIELHGFKSFPDKTKITFDKGMTAVIGPNGSGKSNISDAIRWVLGETSGKELRSAGKMEDIIFGGTSSRGPMGFASVSLILDNSDHSFDMESDEISVTRKYYRGGDGEYFINGSRVRLKDIYELFLDTGLGKSGYSIVGQGKISQIVTAKPENRREIFEEASGISKFRYKKNEAEKKLDAAQENIVRLSDILINLEERVEPLEKESKKAKEFVKLSEEKRGMEISLWLSTVDRSKAQIREQQRMLEICNTDYESIDRQIEEKEKYIDKCYLDVNELIKKGEENLEQIRNIAQNVSDISQKKAVLESEIGYDEEKISEKEEELKLYTSKDKDIGQKKSIYEQQIEDINTRKLQLDKINAEQKLSLDMLVEQEKNIDAEKGNLIERKTYLLGENQNYKIELHGIETQNISAQQAIDKAKCDIETVKGHLNSASEELSELEAFIGQATLKINQNVNIKNGISIKIKATKDKLDKASEQLDSNRQKRIETENRIRILTDMENNLDGFYQSVKSVLTNGKNGRLQGIIGTVVQLIKVEKGYEIAVETALGNALQNIVVQNESCAKQAIEFLKNNKAGRATFLPIDTVKASTFNEKLPQWAITGDKIISVDEKYQHIILNLLGRTIMCEDIQAASKLAKQLNYRYKIVTKDGQQINAGGSFTGGSTNKNVGLYTRKTEIEGLKERLSRLKAEDEELKKQAEKIKESLDLLESQNQGCDAEIDTLTEDKNNCNVERARYLQLVSQYKDSVYLYNEIMQNNAQIINDNNVKQKNLTDIVNNNDIEIEQLSEKILSIGQSDEEYEQKRNAIQEKLHQISLETVALDGELNLVKSNMEQADLLAKQGEERKNQIALEISDIKNGIQQKKLEIGQNEQAITEMQKKTEELDKQNKEYISARLNIEKERNEVSDEVRNLHSQNIELSKKIAKITEKITNMETGYDDIIQKLWEEYELTVQTAREFAFVFDDENQLKKDLAAIKGAIKRLGNVNVGAIEEYKEVFEKYTFLKEQLKDLEDSRQQLQKLITSLNGEMKTLFDESFKAINKNFSRIFKQLFGGGSAELTLTDPENILESGVDISVNPPGKVIKSLTALSGGEQSLIAISIYFAILAHSPSPFCILDEIEAALDDANVTRYANYLHDISNTTQFIVITHRRGTMESADVLYGVTMQDDGISKLLKLDINNVSPSLIN